MKEKKLPLVIYGLLVACLAFVLGYLLGHGSGTTQLTVTASAPAASVQAAPTVEDAPAELEESPAPSQEVPEEEALPVPTAQSPLDLNTATQQQLELLPGIGPELAGRILAYRQANGSFTAKEQLMDVEGIGEKRYADIEPLVTIGGTP